MTKEFLKLINATSTSIGLWSDILNVPSPCRGLKKMAVAKTNLGRAREVQIIENFQMNSWDVSFRPSSPIRPSQVECTHRWYPHGTHSMRQPSPTLGEFFSGRTFTNFVHRYPIQVGDHSSSFSGPLIIEMRELGARPLPSTRFLLSFNLGPLFNKKFGSGSLSVPVTTNDHGFSVRDQVKLT